MYATHAMSSAYLMLLLEAVGSSVDRKSGRSCSRRSRHMRGRTYTRIYVYGNNFRHPAITCSVAPSHVVTSCDYGYNIRFDLVKYPPRTGSCVSTSHLKIMEGGHQWLNFILTGFRGLPLTGSYAGKVALIAAGCLAGWQLRREWRDENKLRDNLIV